MQKRPNKFICAGDIHVFKDKRFEEHQHVFDNLYGIIDTEKPDLIVLTGDIVDSKARLSPEQIKLVRELLYNLSLRAPILMIPGNHDLMVSNKGRMDSLTPIVSSLDIPGMNEIRYITQSGIYSEFGLKWAVWSCMEDQKNPFDGYKKKSGEHIIGLYHGVVSGAKTNTGFTLSGGVDVTEFDQCDMVIMSDIHCQQSFRNNEINYTGSLIQVAVDEQPHGTCLIYTRSGDTYGYRVAEVENQYSTINMFADELKDLSILPTQKIRLKFDSDDMSRRDAGDIAKELKAKYDVKVDVVPTIKRFDKTVAKLKDEEIITAENVSDFFEDYVRKSIDKLGIGDVDSDLKKLLEYDKEFSKGEVKDFELGDFDIYKLVTNNLLSFGPHDNIVDLDRERLVGILGENRTGKSSIIKIIQFVLFYEVPNNCPVIKMINKYNREKSAFGEVYYTKASRHYKITRTVTPKKNKTVDVSLVFNEIDADGNIISDLSKESRPFTETEIRRHLGINETFEMLSIFSAQKRQTEFIDCKNAERLKLMNKFIGQQNCEMKEANVLSVLKDKNATLANLNKSVDNSMSLADMDNELKKLKINLKLAVNDERECNAELHELDVFYSDILTVYNTNLKLSKNTIQEPTKIQEEIDNLINEQQDNQEFIETHENMIKGLLEEMNLKNASFREEYGINIDEYRENTKELNEHNQRLAVLNHEISRNDKQLLVDTCNCCGKPFTNDEKQKVRDELEDLNSKKAHITQLIDACKRNSAETKEQIDEYKAVKVLKDTKESKLQKLRNAVKDVKIEISELRLQMAEYDSVQEAKKIVGMLSEKIDDYRRERKEIENKLSDLKYRIGKYDSSIKSTEKNIESQKQLIKSLVALEDEVRLLKAYRKIVSKDGLPLYVLNNKLDQINKNVNAVIGQVFEFRLEFSLDEKSELKIQFNYDDENEGNDTALASGSETFIINLCIKVALSHISDMPKINSLFIDEGYDSLDSKTIEKLPALFDMLTNYYKNVITISHMDMIKDMCDHRILLERKDKYTHIVS